MKPLYIILGAFLACTIFSFSSVGDKAPQKVKDAFEKKFPNVKKVKWGKENATEWEAEFKINKVTYSANFLEDGTWIETEHDMEGTEIPQNVKTALTESFSGYKIKETEICETPGNFVYEFELKKGNSKKEISINTHGRIVN